MSHSSSIVPSSPSLSSSSSSSCYPLSRSLFNPTPAQIALIDSISPLIDDQQRRLKHPSAVRSIASPPHPPVSRRSPALHLAAQAIVAAPAEGKKKKYRRPLADSASVDQSMSQLRLPILRDLLSDRSEANKVKEIDQNESKSGEGMSAQLSAMELAIWQHSQAYERSLGLSTGEEAIAYFAQHGAASPVKFVYCNRSESGDQFRPYDLTVVDRSAVNPEHFVISSTGVVHCVPGSASEWIPASQWIHESSLFNLLRSIRFFKHYLATKMFRLWRSNVRFRIYCKQRKSLAKRLFLGRESFCEPLIEMNKCMHEMDSIQLSEIQSGTVYLADKFIADQINSRTVATKLLEGNFERVEGVLERVCKTIKDRARQFEHRILNHSAQHSRFAQHLINENNGRVKSMVAIKQEAAQQARQFKYASAEVDMIPNFIRLVDLIQSEHLISKAIDTTKSFLSLLLTSSKSLFQTRIDFAPGAHQFQFSPTLAQFHSMINTMINGYLQLVDTSERIVLHSKFQPFVVTAQLRSTPNIGRIIQNNFDFLVIKRAIHSKIDADFLSINQTSDLLEKYRTVHEFGLNYSNNFDYSLMSGASIDSIDQSMRQQLEWSNAIKHIRDYYNCGIIQVETRQIKLNLLPITDRAVGDIKDLLLKMFHERCCELQIIYQAKIKALDDDPVTLPAFAAHVELFNQIKSEGRALLERSRIIENMHSMMIHYEMRGVIPPADEVVFDDLLSSVKVFERQISATEQKIEDKMNFMRQTVYKNIARLNNELEVQKNLLNEGIFVDVQAAPKDALKAIENWKLIFDDIKQQTQTLQGYQILFDTEPYPFHSLSAIMLAFEVKRDFWDFHSQWSEKSKAWNQTDFLSLDVEAIGAAVQQAQDKLTQFQATADQAAGEAKSDDSKDDQVGASASASAASLAPVLTKVRALVDEWRSLLPLITALGNKAVIKSKHWRKLFNALGSNYYSNEKMKLKKLRQMNLFSHSSMIEELVKHAEAEHQMQNAFAKIQRVWAAKEFQFQPGPLSTAGKEFTLFTGLEAAVEEARANQTEIQELAKSPFLLQQLQSGPDPELLALRDELDLWHRKLELAAESLDEVSLFQRNWHYYSQVFGDPEIQREFAFQTKIFEDLEKNWQSEIIRKLSQPGNRNIFNAVFNSNLLSSAGSGSAAAQTTSPVQRINRELERCEKYFTEYLVLTKKLSESKASASDYHLQSMSPAELTALMLKPEEEEDNQTQPNE